MLHARRPYGHCAIASTRFSPESGGAAAIKSLAYGDEVNKETEPPDPGDSA